MPIWYPQWLLERHDLPVTLDTDKTVLIVTDMQNQIVDPSGVYASSGVDVARTASIVPAIARAVAAARNVGVPVVFAVSGDMPLASTVTRGRLVEAVETERRSLTPEQWAYQFDFVEALTPAEDDLVVTKPGSSAFYGTPLAMYLSRLGTTRIVIAGATTSGAVEATGRDANHAGLRVVTLYDATADWDQSMHDHAHYAVDWAQGQVITVDQLEGNWASAMANS
jgi:nicotinamidase-related amidase